MKKRLAQNRDKQTVFIKFLLALMSCYAITPYNEGCQFLPVKNVLVEKRKGGIYSITMIPLMILL